MTKKMMTFAAVFCCALAVFTACTKDNTPSGAETNIVGSWYGEVTDNTYVLWNYGTVWANTTFNADSTGHTVIYYLYDDILVAMEADAFTYTTNGNQLTMVMKENNKSITATYTAKDNTLTMKDAAREQTFAKTTDEMAKKFDEWNKKDDVIPVAQPCKHTVFIYGNAGGQMDDIIEGTWEATQTLLTDSTNVRVVCMYKYGKPSDNPNIKYAEPGDIVWFELSSKSDLTKIKEGGFQALGLAKEAQELKICNPNTLRFFMEFSSLLCPAEKYTLAIWGHGSGFNPRTDVPGKYDLSHPSPRRIQPLTGVIPDDWIADEEMDMHELRAAIQATGSHRLYTIFFHNCLMGNIESLSEIRDCADYIGASGHVLYGNGELLTAFVYGLIEKGNTEAAAASLFDEGVVQQWRQGYDQSGWNGDFKLMRTAKFDAVLDAVKRLTTRVTTLYPTQQLDIDSATTLVYRYTPVQVGTNEVTTPFYDIADYAHQLAKTTNDTELKTISDDLDRAFSEAIIAYRDLNYSVQYLEHYTLSVCVVDKEDYTTDFKATDSKYLCNYDEGYEQCAFHKYTGWGNWLRMNEQWMGMNPRCGGF